MSSTEPIESFFRIFPVMEVINELTRKNIAIWLEMHPFLKRPSQYPKNSIFFRNYLIGLSDFFEVRMYQTETLFMDHINFEVYEGQILPGNPVTLGFIWTLTSIEAETGRLAQPDSPADINKLARINTAEQFAQIKKVNELTLYRAISMGDGSGRWRVIIG